MFSKVTLQNVYMYGENTIAAIRSVIGALSPPLYPLNWPVDGDVRAAACLHDDVKDHDKTAAVCFMRRIGWLVRDCIAAGYLPVACGASVGPAWARNRAGRPSRSRRDWHVPSLGGHFGNSRNTKLSKENSDRHAVKWGRVLVRRCVSPAGRRAVHAG